MNFYDRVITTSTEALPAAFVAFCPCASAPKPKQRRDKNGNMITAGQNMNGIMVSDARVGRAGKYRKFG